MVPTWLIEDYRGIPKGINKYQCIGVTAGASTPNWVIEKVLEALEKI